MVNINPAQDRSVEQRFRRQTALFSSINVRRGGYIQHGLLLLLIVGALIWLATAYTASVNSDAAGIWLRFKFLSVLLAPPLWLSFAYSVAQYYYITRYELAAWAATLTTLALALYPATRSLVWAGGLQTSGTAFAVEGPWLRAQMLIASLILLGTGIIVARRSQVWFPTEDHTRVLLIAVAVMPLLVHIAYLVFREPTLYIHDPTAMITAICAGVLGRSITVHQRRRAPAPPHDPDLTSVISHEARTLVSGIVGASALLERTMLRPEQATLLSMMRSSGASLLRVLNHTLDLAGHENGSAATQLAPQRCIERTFEAVAVQALTRHLYLGYVIDPAVPDELPGNEQSVSQILLNLVANGLKFTQHGGVFVHVGIHHLAPDRAVVRFAVSDTGVGIPADCQKRLFQAFSQPTPPVSPTETGAGIGLVISRRLAEQMGSTLALASSSSDGTTFHLDLPLEPAMLSTPAPAPMLHHQHILLCAPATPTRAMILTAAQTFGVPVTLGDADRVSTEHPPATPYTMLWVIDGPTGDWRIHAQPYRDLYPELPITLVTWADHAAPEQGDPAEAQLRVLYQPLTMAALDTALSGASDTTPATDQARQTDVGHAAPRTVSILIVDDDPLIRSAVSLMLSSYGHRVATAGTVAEALAAVRRHTVQIILLDIHLGLADGRDLARTLRTQCSADEQPFLVALSGLPTDRHAASYRAAGFDAWFTKPLTIEMWRQIDAAYWQATPQPKQAHSRDPFAEQVAIDEQSWREFTSMPGITPVAVQSFVDSYIADSDTLMREMQRSLREGDMQQINRVAHKLKSSSAMLSANRLASLCDTLDGEPIDPTRCADAVQRIASEYERVRRELQTRHHDRT